MSGPDRWVASFDSASAMVRSLASALQDEPFERLGVDHPLAPLAPAVNVLPPRARDFLYAWSGWGEALPAKRLDRVRAEAISRWVTDHYPQGPFPAAFVGSSNGAAMHLAAALGAPWLPQTFLIPVRRHGVRPDDPQADMAWGWGPGRELLRGNPDLQLHHMHDPNQDRLMIEHMTYFRVKRRRLGRAYAEFLERVLPEGAPIFLVECTKRWPVVRLGPRHVFQFGAVGGIPAEEYLHGSSRVAEYLQRYDVPQLRWDAPEPDEEAPEAEWGFEPALREDVLELARKNGWPVRRLVFEDPMDLSPLVADLYRDWYARRGIEPARLLVESFMLQAPRQALRTGSVPFWMTFNSERDADRLERYLDSLTNRSSAPQAPESLTNRSSPPQAPESLTNRSSAPQGAESGRESFPEIAMMLMNHGTESAGLASIERWRRILDRARYVGRFLGLNPEVYPRDLATFVRYSEAVGRIPISDGGVPPGSLALGDLDAFLAGCAGRYAVDWVEGAGVDSTRG